MPKQKSPSKAYEYLWLAVAAAALFTAVHKSINHGIAQSWYFYGFVFLALAMFLMRKKLRKKTEEDEQNQSEK